MAHCHSHLSWFVVASAACAYETGLLLVCACRTSAASVEPLPRGWCAVAFPRWLHDQSGSTWLIVILIVRRCFGGLCVYETRLLLVSCLVFAHVALLRLPLSFVLGAGAPSLSHVGFGMIKAVRRGSLSFSLFVVASAACVYETGLLHFFAHVALLLLPFPLSLFLGVRAPSLSLGRFMNSKLLDVAHCSLLQQFFSDGT